MDLEKDIRLVDTMIRANTDYTIKDFLDMRREITNLLASKERKSIILEQLKSNESKGKRFGSQRPV